MSETNTAVIEAPPAPKAAEFTEERRGWKSAFGGALVLHAGAHEATRDKVAEVETPEPTATWTPIPHMALLQMVEKSIVESGQRITAEGFGLWGKNGERFFGVMEVQNGVVHNDYSMLIGLRNSHDRSEAAKLGVGSKVFVCDNFAFSAEVQIARLHSKYIMRDLPGLVAKAIGMLSLHRGYQDKRIEAYKEYAIDDTTAHDLIIRALRSRSINTTRVEKVVREWHEPRHPDFEPRTAWSLFNAFTEVLKGSGAALPTRTITLHGLMDSVVGLQSFQPVIDAEAEVIENDGDDADVRIENDHVADREFDNI